MITDEIRRQLRRHPLCHVGSGVAVSHGRDAVMRLIPHRDPMLFVDQIDCVDLEARAACGRVTLDPSWALFGGHFPQCPVFPGALTMEAMGQFGLTLTHFCGRSTLEVADHTSPLDVRAVRIHDASFLAPLYPGDTVVLMAKILAWDLTLCLALQAWRHNELAACGVSEAMIND